MSDPIKAPFDRGAAEREAKGMFPNQALHRAAAAMAGCHPRALDYVRLAPVVVLAANAGKTGSAAYNSGRRAAQPMQGLCERGAKLREVMRFYGVTLQLRALHANVLHPKRWLVVYRLGRMAPSTLAQIIPAARADQDTWLRALTVWAEHAKRRGGDPWIQFDWAASALRTLRRTEVGTAETVVDLAIEAARSQPRGGAVFDPRWTFDQAHAAADRWHAALGRQMAEQKVATGLGVGFTDAVDYAPFSNEPVTVDGFVFAPLRSCEDLYIEGAAMRHCVASYSQAVIAGRSRIFSVRQAGRRVATLELGRPLQMGREVSVALDGRHYYATIDSSSAGPSLGWRMVQLKGPCNSRPQAGVAAACSAFVHATRERALAPKAPPSLRDAFPGVTASFSGEAA